MTPNSLSTYITCARKYGDQLFQVIYLATEDVNTRNNQSLPSDRLRTSVIRQVTELCLYQKGVYMADNPAIFATVDYCVL